MITFVIRNVAGCAAATLKPGPIALVTGPNEQGKSSTLQACAAVLTGKAAMRQVRVKAELPDLVRDGEKEGVAFVANETGNARMDWPAGKYTAEGAEPPHATLIAAGMVSVLDMKAEDRAEILIELLQASPTQRDFVGAMPKEFPADGVTGLWGVIHKNGWEAAEKRVRERRLGLVGQWEKASGVNYGPALAQGWKPAGWAPDLEEQGEDGLNLALHAAKSRVDHAAIAIATERARRQLLRTQADRRDEIERNLEQAIKLEDAARQRYVAAQGARQQCLPIGQTGNIDLNQHPCPHCGKDLIMLDGKPAKPEDAKPIPRDELMKRDQAIKRADEELREAQTALGQLQQDVGRWQLERTAAMDADQELAHAPAIADHHGADAPAADAGIAAAEARLAVFRTWHTATGLQDQIELLKAAEDVCSPAGVRQTKLAGHLEGFNARLAVLCKTLQRPPLSIEPDLSIMFGKRRYEAHSDSGRWRARVAFQIAVAMMDGSKCLVIDAADILDAPSRAMLMGTVMRSQLPAVIAMTAWDPAHMPNLAEKGAGETYWCDDGKVEPYATHKEAAA